MLSVTVWLLDEQSHGLVIGSSTAPKTLDVAAAPLTFGFAPAFVTVLQGRSAPFDLETVDEPWAHSWRQLNTTTFPTGGHRRCVPLRSGDRMLGVLVLAARIDGASYTLEELDLLRCMADQMTSVLLNLRLANEVARGRELEAFRTMSSFVVHDLKNTAASLNLMLKNLPVHFDDPAFLADALRGAGNTAHRIDEMITRLGALRQRPAANAVRADLNQLVTEAVDRLDGMPDMVRIDGDEGRAVLSVTDNGCGMSQAFLGNSLCGPFRASSARDSASGCSSRGWSEGQGGTIEVESKVDSSR